MTTQRKPHIVIVGLGDSGLIAAVRLSKRYAVTAISTKPSFVSGQELGLRLTDPAAWRQEYLLPFTAYRGLDPVQIVHGKVQTMELAAKSVSFTNKDGGTHNLDYDALLIASGTRNGFWRDDQVRAQTAVDTQLAKDAEQFLRARQIAIIGAGPTGVSAAANLALRYPAKDIHLFYSRPQPLPGYHPRVRRQVTRLLTRRGVHLHADHRVTLPDKYFRAQLAPGTLSFANHRPPMQADLILWATGQVSANNGFIDSSLLNTDGFVNTDPYLRAAGQRSVFAVGDVAATDPQRSSARNGGAQLVSHNIDCLLRGRDNRMKRYRAPHYRWGSIIGPQEDGLTVYDPRGGQWRFPAWAVRRILFPCIVRRVIYQGVRS